MSAPRCPFCGSAKTTLVGQWGGQIITAQWQCGGCGSYFEAVREDFDEGVAPLSTQGGQRRHDVASSPARITVRRRIEWIDTDAAGIYHWTAVCRLAEAAEADLHRALGVVELTFGQTPRVAVSFEFERPLRFDDPVEVELAVERVGRTSIAYAVAVVGPEGPAASGRLVTCLVDRAGGEPAELPERLRRALTEAGPQTIW